MANVEFEAVEKVYPGGTRAVTDCNLRIEDGELMVLVGPSGCGKSTLLRLLAGLETVTSGTIRIGGEVVNELTPRERNLAMVFQDYALYPHMTVRGNLEFPLKMRKLSRQDRRERAGRIAAILEIDDLLDRLPKQLSGGQRQRVAMGRALVREPSVFLLDEPLSNLDARLRGQVRVEIAELQRRTRTTMMYVTHDQVEAMTLGQRVTVLHQGRVQQVGTPRELYETPANVFVAGFVGSPPMNLFPTRLSRDGGQAVWMSVAGRKLRLEAPPALPPDVMDTDLTAGVRAEGIRIDAAVARASEIDAEIESTESLGHETLVRALVQGASPAAGVSLVIRLLGIRELATGDRLRLRIESSCLHLFASSGERVG